MAPTVLGKRALRDPGFVPDLRAGRSPRLSTVERVEGWMRAYEKATPEERDALAPAMPAPPRRARRAVAEAESASAAP